MGSLGYFNLNCIARYSSSCHHRIVPNILYLKKTREKQNFGKREKYGLVTKILGLIT